MLSGRSGQDQTVVRCCHGGLMVSWAVTWRSLWFHDACFFWSISFFMFFDCISPWNFTFWRILPIFANILHYLAFLFFHSVRPSVGLRKCDFGFRALIICSFFKVVSNGTTHLMEKLLIGVSESLSVIFVLFWRFQDRTTLHIISWFPLPTFSSPAKLISSVLKPYGERPVTIVRLNGFPSLKSVLIGCLK